MKVSEKQKKDLQDFIEDYTSPGDEGGYPNDWEWIGDILVIASADANGEPHLYTYEYNEVVKMNSEWSEWVEDEK